MIGHTKVPGPLTVLADGFRAELDRLGYTSSSREYKLAEVARLSVWLQARGLGTRDICSARLEEFSADLAAQSRRAPTLVAMRPLLAWLRERSLCGDDPALAPGPFDEFMGRYRHWMAIDRQLAPRTISRYEQGARLFLGSRARQGGGPAGVDGLREEEVTGFLLAEASRGLSAKSLQGRVAELRSLLRFLYLQGMITAPLGEGVPPVPGWKDTGVPRRLAAKDVQALLESCDRATPGGKRDLAILLLLARMGLRAAEVAGLELDDFGWRVGEVVVHGKAGRCDRMPLPAEVGEAVAAYLLEARPEAACRKVFVTLVAPPRAMGHTTVSQMVWRQCRIAGLEPVRAHRLRHALATELLSQGVRLPEIAQVLRQRDLATTAIYAKVDYSALRELALPWLVVR
ncbi:site-specific integrase [Candidatus Nephthysia bennettiae]|uniref:Tyrosine-type recombinase/integrase n=1 Tax=Candidatus Nephthysia bennettiae TaxID=3127016 RepID=A0A934N5X5_9BACT|nr:tyrosine-type recombinase/integrase [Candidatus Dormibacteraeota bacterium]MBJ7605539.1 tyrosine-type recombinase/integrase [Candidatus Dormibacteraeota bacterium]MBJ7613286.1 tyrosine-type recombinase/integrase [Candidatus Dormibacteraeota bacterium]